MAIVRQAMLCNAANSDASGLVSMLGAFVDRLQGPQLPVRGQLWFVARMELEDSDYDVQHTFAIKVEREDDEEQIARIEGGTLMQRPPVGMIDPDMPVGVNVVVPIPAEFRREGLHRVSLIWDGDPLWHMRLKVDAQFSAF